MPGRQQIPSFQLASGTTNERDNSKKRKRVITLPDR